VEAADEVPYDGGLGGGAHLALAPGPGGASGVGTGLDDELGV
jgi:hypothetical protein